MAAASTIKLETSHAVPTAAQNELITPGGEVKFVSRMIDESLDKQDGAL